MGEAKRVGAAGGRRTGRVRECGGVGAAGDSGTARAAGSAAEGPEVTPPPSNRGVKCSGQSSSSRYGTIGCAGVDWVTCTAPRHGESERFLDQLATALLSYNDSCGNELVEAGAHGYKLVSSQGVSWGVRDSDVMLRLSGELAAEWWAEAVGYAGNVSRLDLQVTVKLREPVPLAQLAARAAKRFQEGERGTRGRGRVGKPPVLVLGHGSGDTCYLGSRQSAVFCRLYDKGCESGNVAAGLCEEGEVWRYEIELHDEAATMAAHELRAARERGESVEGRIAAMVSGEFKRRGVRPRFRCDGVIPIRRERKETDREKFLRWLGEQVRTAIENRAEDDPSFKAEALLALGYHGAAVREHLRVVPESRRIATGGS